MEFPNSSMTIGLFGTCGGSKWREPFKHVYTHRRIPFFDPNKEDWNPADAEVEAHHLATDPIILFPVTGETYGTGSLAEVGFSIIQALRLDDRRDIVVLLEMELDMSLTDAVARKESLRARAILKQHLLKLNLPNVYLVDTLEEMLDVSLQLYAALVMRWPLRVYNPQRRPR